LSDRSKRDRVAESPLSAGWRPRIQERCVLVGVGAGASQDSIEELAALARTAGAEPVGRVLQPRSEPDAATYLGRGKIEELHRELHSRDAELAVFDAELSPGQLRTLESRLGVKVIDRTALILDIFALHARSREGKIQVELAQLNYLLPRLRGWGEAMSRLGGGIGTRGPGETKLEVDRQHIRRRITKLRRDIKDMARTRDTKRARRERSLVPQIAIAGYTNAGKSTLMNALTGAGVLVADQLFATLDPTTRRAELPNGRTVTLSDTVGFVSMLPHELVEAFRSTLEEVASAALVLHVADASSPQLEQQVEAVREVLAQIGADEVPEVLVLNKCDLLDTDDVAGVQRRFSTAEVVSATTGEGVDGLLARVQREIPPPPVEVSLLIPFGREDLVAAVYREGEVLERRETPDGTGLRARVHERLYATLKGYER
jgi:GTP-binding protein HflX